VGLNLSVTVAANATAGTFNVPLTATSWTLQHSATLQLTLGKRANVSLWVPTQRVDVAQGASALTNILVNSDVCIQASDFRLRF